MKIDVDDARIAALLRAEGIGWGGSGRTLWMPDAAVPSVKPAFRGLRWLVRRIAAGPGGSAVSPFTDGRARHGTF